MARILRTTSALRSIWGPPCSSDRMVKVALWCCDGASVVVDSRTVKAWAALDAIAKKYNYKFRPADTGAYVCRKITGGSGYSLHAYGIAADFNWSTNPYFPYPVSKDGNSDMPDGMVDEIRNLQTNNGAWVFGWGGDYSSIRDFMHYEIVASPEELATGINFSTGDDEMPLSDQDAFVIGVVVRKVIAEDVTPQLENLKNQEKRHHSWVRNALNVIAEKLGVDVTPNQ